MSTNIAVVVSVPFLLLFFAACTGCACVTFSGQEQTPPVITWDPVTTATEDQPYLCYVWVTDPDKGDEMTFSLDESPADMSIDAATGLIQWTPDNSQVGDQDVTVRVEDAAGLYDTQSFTIAVANVNDAPQITSTAVTTATEDQVYSYDVDATDPDVGDEITFSLDESPTGMTIDAATGLIQWTPDNSQAGDQDVTVRVEDAAGLYDTQSFTINPAHKYAVIVGISDYKVGSDLTYCDEDASSWYYYLVGEGYTCWVYGDGHASDYPSYDGAASEYNVRNAIQNMVDLADSNDYIAFVCSGHGFGDGSGNSCVNLWDSSAGENGHDGDYQDTELAADFENCVAAQLFVFLDTCFSGGMDEVVSSPYVDHVYMATTCTEDGSGWDAPDSAHGAWTYHFLVWGLEGAGHESWDMASCYDDAYEQYETYYALNIEGTGGPLEDWDWNGPDSYDHPMEFDSQPSTPFYL